MTETNKAAKQEPTATPRVPFTRDTAIEGGLILPAAADQPTRHKWRKRFAALRDDIGEAIGEAMDKR